MTCTTFRLIVLIVLNLLLLVLLVLLVLLLLALFVLLILLVLSGLRACCFPLSRHLLGLIPRCLSSLSVVEIQIAVLICDSFPHSASDGTCHRSAICCVERRKHVRECCYCCHMTCTTFQLSGLNLLLQCCSNALGPASCDQSLCPRS